MMSSLASVTFKVADKNFDFITEMPLPFLGFGDFKVSIVIENSTSVLFWNEMSSGVMNFKDFFRRRAKFTGNHTDRSHF